MRDLGVMKTVTADKAERSSGNISDQVRPVKGPRVSDPIRPDNGTKRARNTSKPFDHFEANELRRIRY